MAVNFPSTPSDGQTYTLGNQMWTYSSAKGKWVAANNAPMFVSATAPAASVGALWYDTNDGSLMIYTGAAWVQALGYTLPSGALRSADIGVNVLGYDPDILTKDHLDVLAGRGFFYLPSKDVSGPSTTVGWENIPSWVTQFDVAAIGTSPDTTPSPVIQLGTAADEFVQVGYYGGADQLATGTNFGNPGSEPTGLQIRGGIDADISDFYASFVRVSGSEHIWQGNIVGRLTNAVLIILGTTYIQLNSPLDRVRVSSAGSFDSGVIYARYR